MAARIAPASAVERLPAPPPRSRTPARPKTWPICDTAIPARTRLVQFLRSIARSGRPDAPYPAAASGSGPVSNAAVENDPLLKIVVTLVHLFRIWRTLQYR